MLPARARSHRTKPGQRDGSCEAIQPRRAAQCANREKPSRRLISWCGAYPLLAATFESRPSGVFPRPSSRTRGGRLRGECGARTPGRGVLAPVPARRLKKEQDLRDGWAATREWAAVQALSAMFLSPEICDGRGGPRRALRRRSRVRPDSLAAAPLESTQRHGSAPKGLLLAGQPGAPRLGHTHEPRRRLSPCDRPPRTVLRRSTKWVRSGCRTRDRRGQVPLLSGRLR